ncbi:papilin-like [Xenia sp. Carnegie-2017]|uniref:papilin-like n=1 Tax=Xenia sp. Carnegie-2017 TaxID=2897299 RepID=UPI001F03F5A0|nr:papilin-like [Xenia sp. Carnegie-2017]
MKTFFHTVLIVLGVFNVMGDWSKDNEWSPCSRSCGGGITRQQRICLKGKCEGEATLFKTCNIQDCPDKNADFRAEQCASYNSITFRNETYEWVPYSGPLDNPCSLSCMPKNAFFYKSFKEKVVDGTRCSTYSHDMCVEGECKKAGCDLILGSELKEDKCRVCNGKGQNCRTVKNEYIKQLKGIGGYHDILELPKGATNILITEKEISLKNFLAMRTNDSYIFNGNRRIKGSSYKYKAAGSLVDYRKKGRKESIFVLGPTSESLYLAVLQLTKDVAITYEYSVHKSQTKIDSMITYSWKVGKYGPCDKSCNGGTKKRDVQCLQDRDKSPVDDVKCEPAIKPDSKTVCNTQHCPPRWFIGSWSPCSRSCEEGTQVRRVHCEMDTKSGIKMVNENLCSGTKVITQRKCVELPECPNWKLGNWSKCSKTCGGGIRSRSVYCMEINDNLISDDRCPEHSRPRDQERCNEIPCEVRWVTGDWGKCEPSCEKGIRTRPVYCASVSQPGRRYPDYICNPNDKPDDMKQCNSSVTCPPMWYASMWSKCTAKCGKGIQMRNVFCGVKKSTNTLNILPNGNCTLLPLLKKTQYCIIRPCYTQWIALSWQQCSSTCGSGKRLREVKCYADNEEDKTRKSCDPKLKPPTEDICNLIDCPNEPRETRQKSTVTRPILTVTTPRATRGTTTQVTTQAPLLTTRPNVVTIVSRKEDLSDIKNTLATTKATKIKAITEVTTKATRATTQTTVTQTSKPTTKRLSTFLFPQINDENNVAGMSKLAKIVIGPESSETVAGRDITMPCVATGNPKPEIFWLKGNLDVSVFGQRFKVFPNGTLKISQVQEVDEDLYTCVANNIISRRSQAAYLSVSTPPQVTISKGYTVKQGGKATINCTARGRPRPTLQWYKNGVPLPLQISSKIRVTSTKIYIRKTTIEDHGNYYCKATNKNGERVAHMMLDVMPDEKTRMHDLLNGNCEDSTLESCAMIGKIDGYCDRPYYQKLCCLTCRARNKLQRLKGM